MDDEKQANRERWKGVVQRTVCNIMTPVEQQDQSPQLWRVAAIHTLGGAMCVVIGVSAHWKESFVFNTSSTSLVSKINISEKIGLNGI